MRYGWLSIVRGDMAAVARPDGALKAHPPATTAQPITRMLAASRNPRGRRGLLPASRASLDPASIVSSLLMIPVFVPPEATLVPRNSHENTTEVLPSFRRFLRCCKASSGLWQDCNLSALVHTTWTQQEYRMGRENFTVGPPEKAGERTPDAVLPARFAQRMWTFGGLGRRRVFPFGAVGRAADFTRGRVPRLAAAHVGTPLTP